MKSSPLTETNSKGMINPFEFVKIIPPGTFCTLFGLEDLIDQDLKTINFLEVGCGEGMYSKYILEAGARGTSIDYSDEALKYARQNLSRFVQEGLSKLENFDFLNGNLSLLGKFDVVFSIMVLEHIENEQLFLTRIREVLKPDGVAVIIVPSRMDAWGVEDDQVGHLRRYSHESLKKSCENVDFKVEKTISIGVPVVNLLLRISNMLVAKYDHKKNSMAIEERTKLSGTRDIPFKTTFPRIFRLILNRWSLWPLRILQRCFYRTEMGLISGVRLRHK